MGTTLLSVSLAALATAAVAMAVTALVARARGKVAVVDITWGLVFVAIAWVVHLVGTGSARSLLLAVLVTAWGGRLAWHIRRRALGAGEDPRYEKLLAENESIYIPLGSTHRLSNPGKVPLNLIEVQSGPYLGEDDIVRFEDVYARA